MLLWCTGCLHMAPSLAQRQALSLSPPKLRNRGSLFFLTPPADTAASGAQRAGEGGAMSAPGLPKMPRSAHLLRNCPLLSAIRCFETKGAEGEGAEGVIYGS